MSTTGSSLLGSGIRKIMTVLGGFVTIADLYGFGEIVVMGFTMRYSVNLKKLLPPNTLKEPRTKRFGIVLKCFRQAFN